MKRFVIISVLISAICVASICDGLPTEGSTKRLNETLSGDATNETESAINKTNRENEGIAQPLKPNATIQEEENHLQQIHQNNKTENETVSIIFAGDISMDKPIRKENGSTCDYSNLMTNLTKYFESVDFNMVNVEAPFVTREMAEHEFFPHKGIHNMAWEEAVVALTKAGIKSATISNNHIGDFGGEAAFHTQKVLERNNIEVIGLTKGKKKPYMKQKPLIKEINGIRLAFLAYCGDSSGECKRFREGIEYGPALLKNDTVLQDVTELNKVQPAIDHIIVFIHWGTEYMSIPNEEQREVAIQLRKLGINLIIGSHPHVKQGHEWLNNTLVHYSLGNFVFHPHSTFMGGLSGKANKSAIHQRAIEQSKYSRGPAGFTELFKVILTKTEIKTAYFLPVRIHVDKNTFCLYPKAKVENDWVEVCGPRDDNCYYPRPGSPIYSNVNENMN